jgi:hypothetical protein
MKRISTASCLLAITASFLASLLLQPRAFAQTSGSIDTGFGTLNHLAVFNPLMGDIDVRGDINDVLPLPDGKVLASGSCTLWGSTALHACLYRWDANGVPDRTFGFTGVSQAIASIVTIPMPPFDDVGVRAALRANGAVIVASACNHPSFGTGICVASANPNGIGFDTSFGATGQTFVPLPAGFASSMVETVAVLPDGKVLVGATCFVGANFTGRSSTCVTRLTTSAVFDPAFGVGNWSVTTPALSHRLIKLVPLPDGQYYAIADCMRSWLDSLCSNLFWQNGAFRFALFDDIRVDHGYLIDGRVIGKHITLQWAAIGDAAQEYFYAARRYAYSASGDYDTWFGGTPSPGVARLGNRISQTNAVAGAILSNGSLLYMNAVTTPEGDSLWFSQRLTSSGFLDLSYGIGGRMEYAGLASPWGYAWFDRRPKMVEAYDGKIIVASQCSDAGFVPRPCALRLHR